MLEVSFPDPGCSLLMRQKKNSMYKKQTFNLGHMDFFRSCSSHSAKRQTFMCTNRERAFTFVSYSFYSAFTLFSHRNKNYDMRVIY